MRFSNDVKTRPRELSVVTKIIVLDSEVVSALARKTRGAGSSPGPG